MLRKQATSALKFQLCTGESLKINGLMWTFWWPDLPMWNVLKNSLHEIGLMMRYLKNNFILFSLTKNKNSRENLVIFQKNPFFKSRFYFHWWILSARIWIGIIIQPSLWSWSNDKNHHTSLKVILVTEILIQIKVFIIESSLYFNCSYLSFLSL